jgi:NADH-quinone oxidoreductase subunit D
MHNSDEFKIPMGPQHPALKEPEGFSVALKGEKILGVDIRLGYNHRGIEKAAEERTYLQDIYLLERVCGICSHSHSTCFVQAVEEVAQLAVPQRALFIRTIIAELERIHSHLLWLGVAGHEIGFDTLLMYSWRDREVVMDILASITGNRVNYGMNTIGGVRRDINLEQAEEILKGLDILEERTKYYIEVVTQETTIIKRLSGVGVLSYDDAIRLDAVGPTARASGVRRDVRKDDPYAAYGQLSFEVVTDNHCDVYGRAVVRVKELLESYKIIRQALKDMPDGPISVRMPRSIPAGEALSRYEAPRGEDVHYVKGNGTDKPERVKVRAPTLANVQAVKHMLRDRFLADMPIVIAAIDPCFSCTDRTVSLNRVDCADKKVIAWPALHKYSIEWHKARGIDFTVLNRKMEERFGR